MYQITITPKNENADSKYFNQWMRENHSSEKYGISYDENGFVTLSFVVEPLQSVIDNIVSEYQSLTTSDIIPTAPIMPVYSKMQRDGYKYSFDAKAKYFGLGYQPGLLTDDNILYLYKRLSQPLQMLENGDYKPALLYLLNDIVTPNETDISNGYTPEIHDSIIDEINTYLDSME